MLVRSGARTLDLPQCSLGPLPTELTGWSGVALWGSGVSQEYGMDSNTESEIALAYHPLPYPRHGVTQVT